MPCTHPQPAARRDVRGRLCRAGFITGEPDKCTATSSQEISFQLSLRLHSSTEYHYMALLLLLFPNFSITRFLKFVFFLGVRDLVALALILHCSLVRLNRVKFGQIQKGKEYFLGLSMQEPGFPKETGLKAAPHPSFCSEWGTTYTSSDIHL